MNLWMLPLDQISGPCLFFFCTCFFKENLHIFEVSIMHLFNGIFGVNPTFCYFVFSSWKKKKTSCILLIYLWWFDLNDESATYVVCDSWPRWANISHYLIRQTRRFMFIYLDASHWFFNAHKLLQSFFRWSCRIWTSWQIGSTLNVHKKALLSVSYRWGWSSMIMDSVTSPKGSLKFDNII